mgnify:CR=1 FL=1
MGGDVCNALHILEVELLAMLLTQAKLLSEDWVHHTLACMHLLFREVTVQGCHCPPE